MGGGKLQFNDSVEVYFYPAGQMWDSDSSNTDSDHEERSDSEMSSSDLQTTGGNKNACRPVTPSKSGVKTRSSAEESNEIRPESSLISAADEPSMEVLLKDYLQR